MPFTRSAKAREQAEVAAAKAASVVTAEAEPQSQAHHDVQLDEAQSSGQHVRAVREVDPRSSLSNIFDEEMDVDEGVLADVDVAASNGAVARAIKDGPGFGVPDPNVGMPDGDSMEIDSIVADVVQDLSDGIHATSDEYTKTVIHKASGNVAQKGGLSKGPQGIDGTQSDNGRQVPYNSARTVVREHEKDKSIKRSRPEATVVVIKFSDKTAFGKKLFAIRNAGVAGEGDSALKQEHILQEASTDEDFSTQGKLVVRKRKADTVLETQSHTRKTRTRTVRSIKVDRSGLATKGNDGDDFVMTENITISGHEESRYALRRRDRKGVVLQAESIATDRRQKLAIDIGIVSLASQSPASERELNETNVAETQDGQESKSESAIVEVRMKIKVKTMTRARMRKGFFTNKYNFKFGHNPYPDFKGPTVEECWKVYQILKDHHAKEGITVDRKIEGPMHAADAVTIDALVNTLMSQSTANSNALMALDTLRETYRYVNNGKVVRGGVPNYHAIRTGDVATLTAALRTGGLHNMRGRVIKGILDVIFAKNLANLQYGEIEHDGNPPNTAVFVPGLLSLAYMNDMSMQEKFDYLVNLPSIAVKTACCILAFSFRLPVFAVDTHVFRLAKWLGWVPKDCPHPDIACAHLDVKIPDELKFALHQAFWHHGQRCARCKARTSQESVKSEVSECPIEEYLDRSRPEKKPDNDKKVKQAKSANNIAAASPTKRAAKRGNKTIVKMTPEEAAEKGYTAENGYRALMIDDGFGVPGSNLTGIKTYIKIGDLRAE